MGDPNFVYGRTLLKFLASNDITIAVSSYQSHQILAIGVNDVDTDPDLSIYICPITRCMGMARYKDRVVISNIGSLIVYNHISGTDTPKHGYFTGSYQPRFQYHSPDVDIHDLKVTNTGIYYISATYNCIAMPSLEKTFEPYWIPPWITLSTDINDPTKKYMRREDCCHLNGLCCVDEKPKYVTSASRGNILGHWRTHKSEGFVYDIQKNEVVCEDIHSPHSPNWYRDQLWVFESGTGYFGYVDFKTKSFVKKIFLPGFLRGLTFHDKYAIACLSKDRHDHAFHDLPLRENLRCNGTPGQCGFRVIDMDTFSVIEEFTFGSQSGITELYDVICLPGNRTRILNPGENDAVEHHDKLFGSKKLEIPVSDVFDVSICKEPVPGKKAIIASKEQVEEEDDDPYFLPPSTI